MYGADFPDPAGVGDKDGVVSWTAAPQATISAETGAPTFVPQPRHGWPFLFAGIPLAD
jgi:hypothetical protein